MAVGQPQSYQRLPTLTPGQLGIKGQVGNQALQMLQGLQGGNFNFEPIAQQARTQFNTQTVPGLAERFTSLGSGAQRSSAFAGQLGQAGAGLDQGLAALKSQYGLKQQGMQQQLLSTLLQLALSPSFTYKGVNGQEGDMQGSQDPFSRLLQQYFGDQEAEEGQDMVGQDQGGGGWGDFFKNAGKFVGSNAARYAPEAAGAYFGGPVGAGIGRGAGTALQALFNHFVS